MQKAILAVFLLASLLFIAGCVQSKSQSNTGAQLGQGGQGSANQGAGSANEVGVVNISINDSDLAEVNDSVNISELDVVDFNI